MAAKPLTSRLRQRPRPLRQVGALNDICLEVFDHSVTERPAVQFFGVQSRDPYPLAARLAQQFELQNRALLSVLDVSIQTVYDGKTVMLRLTGGNNVGAIPLLSPTTAMPDYGLVVQPRFPWRGIGPMLAEMDWRIAPLPLKLPLLHRSERRVPPWVLSSMILSRLKLLLENLTRRFELVTEIRTAPRGTVRWSEFAVNKVSKGEFLSIPCVYPDLREDRELRGAIRYTLERQLRSLQTQSHFGTFVHQLIESCTSLLNKVQDVAPAFPARRFFQQWSRRPMQSSAFKDGLQAIEWTAEDRGLAGISDLEGIPWTMRMDEFFEAFVEMVFRKVATRAGARFKVGRMRETTHPISWSPPYAGSQKSLIPDVWLEWGDKTLIVEAKYKRHWESLQEHSWTTLEDSIRNEHRTDLFQALAYGNLADTTRVISCLVYPCAIEMWGDLQRRGRLFHKAEILVGKRRMSLWLTALPMGMSVDKIVPSLEEALLKDE